jgi:hypothetical protein
MHVRAQSLILFTILNLHQVLRRPHLDDSSSTFVLFWLTGMKYQYEPLTFLNSDKTHLFKQLRNDMDGYVFSTLEGGRTHSTPVTNYYCQVGMPCLLELNLPRSKVINLIHAEDTQAFLKAVCTVHPLREYNGLHSMPVKYQDGIFSENVVTNISRLK